jgi:hypothetical protein
MHIRALLQSAFFPIFFSLRQPRQKTESAQGRYYGYDASWDAFKGDLCLRFGFEVDDRRWISQVNLSFIVGRDMVFPQPEVQNDPLHRTPRVPFATSASVAIFNTTIAFMPTASSIRLFKFLVASSCSVSKVPATVPLAKFFLNRFSM